jgi:predicted esterase
VDYVRATLDAVAAEYETLLPIVFAGFSQGVAVAFRAAARLVERPIAVIAVGGDVPPELGTDSLRHISAALICRGAFDALYPAEQFAIDVRRLRDSGVRVQPFEFDGGHEWSRPVVEAVALFISDWGR